MGFDHGEARRLEKICEEKRRARLAKASEKLANIMKAYRKQPDVPEKTGVILTRVSENVLRRRYV